MSSKIQKLNHLKNKRFAVMAVAALAAVGIAILGVYLTFGSHAATPFVSIQPEGGTATRGAVAVSDSNASAGFAIKFRGDAPQSIYRDVKYGSDAEQAMDIYTPTNGQVEKAVIVVHGGGWHTGDKTDPQMVGASQDLADSGFAVFNMNYRLASKAQVGYPMQVDDLKAAVAWVKQNGPDYKANTTTISLLGGSAGAHLVMLTSLKMNQQTPGTISKVVSLSGPTDFTVYSGEGNPGIEAFLGCKIESCPAQLVKDASPLYNVNARCPAFRLYNSQVETTPLSQAQDMQDKLVQTSCASTLTVVPGTQHSFGYFDEVDTSIFQFLKN